MRRRSFAGPLLLVLFGCLFLWRNLHPEAPIFDLAARYWPFVLITWGIVRLAEVLVWRDRSGPSFSGGEVVLIVFLCVIGSGMWMGRQHGFRLIGGGLDMFGEQFDYTVSSQASASGMKRIAFE